ncbi:flagellar basal body P-ring formation chaperone FlgA [Tepidiphilus olei]|uniref:flagellar basal body P-ring formation chaperone FlgA n=1 Tax=Tepidiphilus olei TaxID=2502184 RepID=UPI00115DF7B1|nr:flagellar basal body P-ring formation chaperone FlgA [Tepidiphilus olei]
MNAVRLFAFFFAFALGLCSLAAEARQEPQAVEQTVRAFLQQATAGLPGRVQIEVDPFDPYNQLPPCRQLQAFVPENVRLWGRVAVGVRCTEPTPWTAYLTARVAVFGAYYQSARPLRAGQVLSPDDLRREEGELTALPEDVVLDASRVVGARLRGSLAAGQPLRQSQIVLPDVVSPGMDVVVRATGPGFVVENRGKALNRAAPGETVRVRLEGGRVVSGQAQPDGSVALGP